MEGTCCMKRDHKLLSMASKWGWNFEMVENICLTCWRPSMRRQLPISRGILVYVKRLTDAIHFLVLPRDIGQQIFNGLVHLCCLTDSSLEAFIDYALQDVHLGECVICVEKVKRSGCDTMMTVSGL